MRILHTAITVLAAIIITFFATALFYTSYYRGDVHQGEATIKALTHGEATIVDTFKSIGTLQGFLVKVSGHTGVVYTDHTGKYLISGPVVKADGTNITQMQAQKYLGDHSKAAQSIYQSISKTGWVEQGQADAPHKLYVFTDPNCIFCHKLYHKLQPMIEQGKVAVRWVITGLVKASSQGKAFAILTADNPKSALASNESGFNTKIEQGGIKPVAKAPDNIKKKVQLAAKLLSDHNIPGTPAVLYKDAHGKPGLYPGLPRGEALQNIISKSGNQF